jgi:hypothetical protein
VVYAALRLPAIISQPFRLKSARIVPSSIDRRGSTDFITSLSDQKRYTDVEQSTSHKGDNFGVEGNTIEGNTNSQRGDSPPA